MIWVWKQGGGIMCTQENEKGSTLSGIKSGFCTYFKIRLVMIGSGILIGILSLILMIIAQPRYTEITDIAKYGCYNEAGDDHFVSNFVSNYINSFFPAEIEDNFSDVVYSYKAESTDTYGFEAYLEFSISDKTQFDDHIASIEMKGDWVESDFAPGFLEYNIENVLVLDEPDADDDPTSIFYRQIIFSKIRKILYSLETQTVIYVAIGVYDGGGIGTNYLNKFFDRFQIDPDEYAKTTQSRHNVNPYSIN